MGRPSKQKQIVQKYFKKKLIKKGKLDCYECVFCVQTFAYNSWRMAKHLINCTKTTIDFQNYDLPIIKKIFKNDTSHASNNTILNTTYDEYLTENEGLTKETISTLSPQQNTICYENDQSLVSSQSSTCSVQSLQTTSSILKKTMNMDRFIERFVNQEEQVNIKYPYN